MLDLRYNRTRSIFEFPCTPRATPPPPAIARTANQLIDELAGLGFAWASTVHDL